jgi:DNA-binding transcriptional regulator YiaG
MQFCTIFYFRRKNPPATVCWRVRAKMSCNAMQRGIEWRMDKIKDAIQSLRRTLSQSEIARRTGIAQHKISRWESGGIPAGASDALKLIELAKEVAAAAPAQEAAE